MWSTVNFPSSVAIVFTLCPVASMAPASLVYICPVVAAITLSKGFNAAAITSKLACVPPLTK